MPVKRKTRRPRRRAHKKAFVPRALAIKRNEQISTKIFYFKDAGKIAPPPAGNLTFAWSTLQYNTTPPSPNIGGDFAVISKGYQEYKVLAVKITLYAANIGIESVQPGFTRGVTAIYKDQDYKPGQAIPTDITDVINLGSCKVIPSRVDKWSTVMYRSSGNTEWGDCDQYTPQTVMKADSWSGAIQLLQIGASNALVWFWTSNYKVIFRGRSYAT